MSTIEYEPIGVIHSPFTNPKGMPIQPSGASGEKGTVEVFRAYQLGLKDLEGFSHIILLYHFHNSRGYDLTVVPFLDSRSRGLFATRAPRRPNSIGLSVVKLVAVQEGSLEIMNVDVLDGTPLLDIKPFVPKFDAPTDVRTGWLKSVAEDASEQRSDGRFQ